MDLFVIDKDKCKKDYICIAECPYGFIFERDNDGFPKIREGSATHCINCGHCVAVCPNEALSLLTMSPESCIPVQKRLSINPDEVEQFLKSRRSFRAYKNKSIPHKTLIRLIDTTRWAPSASNRQPVHWLFVETQSEVQKLSGLVVDWMRENDIEPDIVAAWEQDEDMVLRGAPHLAIAHANSDYFWAVTDSAIALTYLELTANALGLGACWAGYFTKAVSVYPPLAEALDIPDNHKVCGAMMLGYPKFRFPRIPQRNEAKVSWI